mmetsp:Transcript_18496/g.40468  ORF Transcript_18496/g.40468 Transcript_18496/m.40468 type:complete len:451 (+) Transcript_18496:834-2186(+)
MTSAVSAISTSVSPLMSPIGSETSACSAATQMGTSSAEKRFPLSCCVASTAFSSEGYVTSTASSALTAWTGPAMKPRRNSTGSTTPCGTVSESPNATPRKESRPSVAARHAIVTSLNSFVRSTYPPIIIPPSTMANWNPAPARLMVDPLTMPARTSSSSVNAETVLVTAMLPTNAASGMPNPLVRRKCRAVAGYVRNPLALLSASLLSSCAITNWAAADAEGNEGGRSSNLTQVAAQTSAERTVTTERYSERDRAGSATSVLLTSPTRKPPTRNAVAMPTWLKLMATAVARARSLFPNQVALSCGGKHWNTGWAAPTSTVPATTCAYDGTRPAKGTPDRKKHPAVMSAAAPTTLLRRPNVRAMSVKKKQENTFVKRKMSMSCSAPCPVTCSQVFGMAELPKHTQSEISASKESRPSWTQRWSYSMGSPTSLSSTHVTVPSTMSVLRRFCS